MDSFVRKSKDINTLTQTIVYGFIHSSEDSTYIIHDIPIFIILSYFYNYQIHEHFDVNLFPSCNSIPPFNYDSQSKTIKHSAYGTNGKNHTIYGYFDINGSVKGIYQWIFKIIRNDENLICIGIELSGNKQNIFTDFCDIDSFKIDNKSDFYATNGYDLYCKNTENISFQTYKEYEWNDNDLIKMEINTNNGTILYFINDINQGIAFKNIKFNHIIFNLAVSFFMNESLQLIDFNFIDNNNN